MNSGLSGYLDVVRIGAAFEVFLYHLGYHGLGHALPGFAWGHQAVIVFFVISGYVIAYVTNERETDIFSFALARASRIYSVVLPALLLAAAIEVFLLHRAGQPFYADYQLAQPWKYLPLFLVFGTDWWFLNEDAFSNLPYWSLSYEVWYYVLFACWRYFRGGKRWLSCAAVLILVGPRSWLLLPVWVAGAALYYRRGRPCWPRGLARTVWASSLAAIGAVLVSGVYALPSDLFYHAVGQELRDWLRYSQFFLGDYGLAALLVVNLAAAERCQFNFGRWRRPLRYVSVLTFALYLFHYPLLRLFATWLSPAPLALAVLVTVWALGMASEQLRKNLRGRLAAAFALGAARAQRG